jgi:hypothetical protein
MLDVPSGHMTGAMHAASPCHGPRLLRVAIAQGGRIVDERLIKQRQEVTVGNDEACTFFAQLPDRPSFALFAHRDGGWELNCFEGVTGIVDSGDGARELGSHRGASRHKLDDTWSIRLGEAARGRVAIGKTVLLFQLVDAPAALARPQLPMSVMHRAEVDWTFTIVAAFSFAAHFAVLGALTSDWTEGSVDDSTYISGVVDAVIALPSVAPPPDDRSYEAADDRSSTEQPQPGAPAPQGKPGAPGPGAPRPSEPGLSPGDRASMLNELQSMEMLVAGVMGSSAPATERVLHPGEHPSGDLDAIARSAAGNRPGGTPGLDLGGGPSRVTPGIENGFPMPLAPATATAAASAAEVRPPPATPVPTVQAQPQATCTIKNVQAAVAKLRPGFRQCYMKLGLGVNPEMEGGVQVTAMVGPNGEVQSVRASASGTISPAVSACVADRVHGAQFDPPECGTATVVIPVWLKHQ